MDAIPKYWKSKINNETCKYTANPKFSLTLNNRATEISKITSRKVYSELIRDMVKEPTATEIWLDLFPSLGQIEWSSVFTLTYKITKEPYLQSI